MASRYSVHGGPKRRPDKKGIKTNRSPPACILRRPKRRPDKKGIKTLPLGRPAALPTSETQTRQKGD